MICFCKDKMEEIIINKNEYFKCNNCGYLMKKNILSDELQKKRYDSHICDASYYEYMNKIYASIKNYIYGSSILDYGCGKVHALSDILNSNGYHCSYYDLFYYPNLENKKYDSIILIEVFEHILEPYKLLNNLKEMLNKNGKIIVMTKPIIQDINNWWYLRDTTHVSFVEARTMKKLADMLLMKLLYIEELSLFVFSCI